MYRFSLFVSAIAAALGLTSPLHAQTTVDGILFSSRLTASPCVAIFDKAFAALTAPIPAALPRVPALTDETSRLGITVRRRRGTGRP